MSDTIETLARSVGEMNRFGIDVIDALQQIASKSEQIDLHEAAETPINVPAELLKNWKQAYQTKGDGGIKL